jgi:excisionase family DNA binding protein
MANTEERFLTVRELADYLRVSRRKAYELVAAGEVPSFRVGSSLRIPRAELDAQLSASAQKGGELGISER